MFDRTLVSIYNSTMAAALLIPRRSTQSQGAGSRLLRRLGGAVRNVIAGSLTLAGGERRLAASRPRIGHAAARNAGARPAPEHAPRARRPRSAPPASPPRPSRFGWLAGLFRRRTAPLSLVHLLDAPDAPFTPEEFPGLDPELCEILNTPLEDCDPDTLRHLFAAFARTIADLMPPEAGRTDVQALISTLWDRFVIPLDGAWTDVPPGAAQDAPPSTPMPTIPPAPVVSPDRLPQASSVMPDVSPDLLTETPPLAPIEAFPGAPLVSPPRLPAPQAADPPRHPHGTIAATNRSTAPEAAIFPGPIPPRDCSAPNRHLFLYRIGRALHRAHRNVGCPHSCLSRFLLDNQPLRHCYYAARASPA